MINTGLFTSNTNEWETPQKLYDELNKEFNFNLDVCATDENTKCDTWFTKKDDGLSKKWIGNVWCNPPYSKDEMKYWVKRAHEEVRNGNANVVVMLIPSRTDTRYFHNYIYNKYEIRFIKGRIKFLLDGEVKQAAPFPSMIVVMKLGG